MLSSIDEPEEEAACTFLRSLLFNESELIKLTKEYSDTDIAELRGMKNLVSFEVLAEISNERVF